jgi:heme-degrading monooxygenase HmoA
MASGQPYTSGNWLVQSGTEEQFIRAWTDFTEWSLANAKGAQSFVLIRQVSNARHFVSFGAWEDSEAVERWRQSPEFGERLGKCIVLCDEFDADDYTLAASPRR